MKEISKEELLKMEDNEKAKILKEICLGKKIYRVGEST